MSGKSWGVLFKVMFEKRSKWAERLTCHEYWLKTPVLSIVGSSVLAAPFHAHVYPP